MSIFYEIKNTNSYFNLLVFFDIKLDIKLKYYYNNKKSYESL